MLLLHFVFLSCCYDFVEKETHVSSSKRLHLATRESADDGKIYCSFKRKRNVHVIVEEAA